MSSIDIRTNKAEPLDTIRFAEESEDFCSIIVKEADGNIQIGSSLNGQFCLVENIASLRTLIAALEYAEELEWGADESKL